MSTASAGKVKSLPDEGILAFVDSTLPYIWLLESACRAFEDTCRLTWDHEQQLYFLNSSTHSNLLKLNPTIVFKLGNSISAGPVVVINLPYSAFDLNATAPLVNTSSYYFPLKRAANETQYTLGRTFLQEAYLIADYGHQNLSISQCTWNTGLKEQIVAIHPPSSESSNSTDPSPIAAQSHHKGLSSGAVAGIIIAAVLALAIIALLIFDINNRRQGHTFFGRHSLLPELSISADKVEQGKSGELDSESNLHSILELGQTDPRLSKDVKHEMESPPMPLYRSQQGSTIGARGKNWRSEAPGEPVSIGLTRNLYESGGNKRFEMAELHMGESGVPGIQVKSPK